MCTLYQNKKWSKQKTADDGCCGRSSGGRKCPRTDLGRMHHPTLPGHISWCVSYTSTELSCLIYTETGKQEVGRNTASRVALLRGQSPASPVSLLIASPQTPQVRAGLVLQQGPGEAVWVAGENTGWVAGKNDSSWFTNLSLGFLISTRKG